ncbi:MAG: O-antigen ligase family protein [Oscillatoria princeps RMCB-10]|nr:O-antigen ligase family protein [Oscillatoria princeps RMCB-10]
MRYNTKPLSFLSSRHPEPRLQVAWSCAGLSLLLLPLSPLLGSSGLGLAMLLIWRQKFGVIVRRPLNWGFAALTGWLAITAGLAADQRSALLGLFNFLPFFAFFAALSTLIQTPAQLRRIAWILLAGSVPVAIVGFGQMFWGWSGPVRVLWALVDWPLEPAGTPPGRMASVFAHANVLANYQVIVFSLGLGLWVDAVQELRHLASERRQKVRDENDPRIVRVVETEATEYEKQVWRRLGFLSLAVLGNAAALILTNSRSAWAIAGLASLAFALYLAWLPLVAAVAGAAGGVFLAAFGPVPVRDWLRGIVPAYFWARLTDQMYPNRPVPTLRVTQWKFAWEMVLLRPWTGWGLRNFSPLYKQHFAPLYQGQALSWPTHPHNLFVMLACETGIPGMLLFCSLVGWAVARGVLLLRDWPAVCSAEGAGPVSNPDKLIFFSYLVAFAGCTLFHLFDVTLFDSRVNILGWLLLSGIFGVVCQKGGNEANSH